MSSVSDFGHQLLVTIRGMWLRSWAGVLVAWLVAAASIAVIWIIPDRYEAASRIFVDTQSILRPVMTGLAAQPSVDQQAALVGRTLISRPNIDKLLDSTDLAAGAKSARDREILAENVMRRLEMRVAGRENIYSLSFWDTDPVRAKQVVEKLTGIFVESTRRAGRTDTTTAKQFVEEQIGVYEAKLRDAENRLKEFRLKNLGVTDSGRDYFSRITEVNNQLSQARLELREAENSRDALNRQIAGEAPMITETRDQAQRPPPSDLDVRIEAVQRNLDSLLQRFTEDHPDVVGARRVLAGLEEQRRRERLAAERGGARDRVVSSTTNQVYQELRVSLARADASVASLRARVGEYEGRLRQYQQTAKMVPQVEAELAQLNRDYEINKRNYEGLVSRRESLEIGGDMQDAGGADIRIVDPPRVPAAPYAPKRALLFVAGLIAALVAGAGASLAASRIWPRYIDSKQLREATGLPVIGTVSYRPDESVRRRERWNVVGFVTSVGTLCVGYVISVGMFYVLAGRAGI